MSKQKSVYQIALDAYLTVMDQLIPSNTMDKDWNKIPNNLPWKIAFRAAIDAVVEEC